MAQRMLTDPPDLWRHAARGDPPIDKWPGHIVTRERLMQACGDPRDWFRYGHRYEAYRQVWAEFADARRRRRKFASGDGNQIIVIGGYGAGKTTLAVLRGMGRMRLGHPLFSNAGVLVGWELEREELYTAMPLMPAGSTFVVDESSSYLSGRMAMTVAVNSFEQSNLNTRKKDCEVIYPTAHDWGVAPGIRTECEEVWMPVPKKDLVVHMDGGWQTHLEGEDTLVRKGRLDPANDPDNFRIAWYRWTGKPYKKANIIEEANEGKKNLFGEPEVMYDDGENVRRAYLLTDTFQQAEPGAARQSEKDAIKDRLDAIHEGAAGSPNGAVKPLSQSEERKAKLLAFLSDREHDHPEYFKAADIGRAIGVGSSVAGKVIQATIPVSPVRNKGYPAAVIYDFLDEALWEDANDL